MLILGLKEDERVSLFDKDKKLGEVFLQRKERGVFRVAFDFPKSVRILRNELLEKDRK